MKKLVSLFIIGFLCTSCVSHDRNSYVKRERDPYLDCHYKCADNWVLLKQIEIDTLLNALEHFDPDVGYQNYEMFQTWKKNALGHIEERKRYLGICYSQSKIVKQDKIALQNIQAFEENANKVWENHLIEKDAFRSVCSDEYVNAAITNIIERPNGRDLTIVELETTNISKGTILFPVNMDSSYNKFTGEVFSRPVAGLYMTDNFGNSFECKSITPSKTGSKRYDDAFKPNDTITFRLILNGSPLSTTEFLEIFIPRRTLGNGGNLSSFFDPTDLRGQFKFKIAYPIN